MSVSSFYRERALTKGVLFSSLFLSLVSGQCMFMCRNMRLWTRHCGHLFGVINAVWLEAMGASLSRYICLHLLFRGCDWPSLSRPWGQRRNQGIQLNTFTMSSPNGLELWNYCTVCNEGSQRGVWDPLEGNELYSRCSEMTEASVFAFLLVRLCKEKALLCSLWMNSHML